MSFSLMLQIAAMFIIPLLNIMIPIFLGEYYGSQRAKNLQELHAVAVSSVVAAAFGLLAFMLAFTFQITTNRFDKRKEMLIKEASNIRTAYLRAGLLNEPFRSGTKKMMVEYVDIRVAFAGSPALIDEAKTRSQVILDSCWRFAEALAKEDRSSEVYALYTSSINDLYDSYNERIAIALEYRIPGLIFWGLGIITFLTMFALGYQFGISGKGSFKINLLLSLIFAVVMSLILMLDRPETGMFKLSQKPLLRLQQELKNAQQKNEQM
jgi:hypothetical protein